MTIDTTISPNDDWEFKSNPNFNKIYVDGLTGTDGDIILNGESIYDLLSAAGGGGGGGGGGGSDVSGLSGSWESTYTTVNSNSATWEGMFCGKTLYINQISACSTTITISGDLDLTNHTVSAQKIVFNDGSEQTTAAPAGSCIPLPSGVNTYTVTGLNLASTPKFFQVQVMNPAGNGLVIGTQRAGTASTDGFIADFSSLTPVTGYELGWFPVNG